MVARGLTSHTGKREAEARSHQQQRHSSSKDGSTNRDDAKAGKPTTARMPTTAGTTATIRTPSAAGTPSTEKTHSYSSKDAH
jgi:hypothetical protein